MTELRYSASLTATSISRSSLLGDVKVIQKAGNCQEEYLAIFNNRFLSVEQIFLMVYLKCYISNSTQLIRLLSLSITFPYMAFIRFLKNGLPGHKHAPMVSGQNHQLYGRLHVLNH